MNIYQSMELCGNPYIVVANQQFIGVISSGDLLLKILHTSIMKNGTGNGTNFVISNG